MHVVILTNQVGTDNGWATVSHYLGSGLAHTARVTTLTQQQIGSPMGSRPLTTLAAFLRTIRRVPAADVVICNVEPQMPLAALLKRWWRCRLLLIGHGTYIYFPYMRGPLHSLRRLIASAADVIVVPSAFTAAQVRQWWKGPLKIIAWGVDIERYHPVESCRQQPSEAVFVSVGQPKERKGTSSLLKAFELVLKRHPAAHLYFVGATPGGYRQQAQARCGDSVVFTGHVDHDALLRYYSRSLCHVLPSRNVDGAMEGFGLVHLEANACGIPSIGSLGTANESVILPGINGELVDPDDVDALAERMVQLIEQPEYAARLRVSSLAHARAHSWEPAVRSLQDVLSTLLASRR